MKSTRPPRGLWHHPDRGLTEENAQLIIQKFEQAAAAMVEAATTVK